MTGVALFGSGWIQDRHALGVLDHPDGELVAVTNWREPSARALAERYGIPRVELDWERLAADPAIDAAIVSTPNVLHAPQTVALLERGKHVLVEKPMATSVAECDAMIRASEASGAILMVAHCWRFHERVRAMRERIASGALGEIVKTRGYGIHVHDGPGGWFVDPALAGGGALVDMGVHAIDTARFLLGDPDPVRVSAAIGTRYGDYAVDDDGIVLISWSNGTNSIVESGWWQPHAGGVEADTEVYGTRGYARIWDAPTPPEASPDPAAPEASPDPAAPEAEGQDEDGHATRSMYSAQVAAFLDAIAAGRPPRPSGEDGRVVLRIVEDAYRSSAGA